MRIVLGVTGGIAAYKATAIIRQLTAAGHSVQVIATQNALRFIGATTLDEYQKYFEKDKALERRFQKVLVDEPDTESAISILRGIKEKYETHHKVRIKDDAIIAAVELSQRYITNRFLPDKAIDLMDEAASKLRMEINSKPEELDVLDRKIMQLEIEIEAIKRENDATKLKSLGLDLANLKEDRNEIFTKWKSEKDVVDSIQNVKQEIEDLAQAEFNAVLCNYYRDGQDSMGWHSDNEKEMDSTMIASVSIGGERVIKFKSRSDKKRLSFSLPHGSLLLMENFQTNWQHAIGKVKSASPRINFTFRKINS